MTMIHNHGEDVMIMTTSMTKDTNLTETVEANETNMTTVMIGVDIKMTRPDEGMTMVMRQITDHADQTETVTETGTGAAIAIEMTADVTIEETADDVTRTAIGGIEVVIEAAAARRRHSILTTLASTLKPARNTTSKPNPSSTNCRRCTSASDEAHVWFFPKGGGRGKRPFYGVRKSLLSVRASTVTDFTQQSVSIRHYEVHERGLPTNELNEYEKFH